MKLDWSGRPPGDAIGRLVGQHRGTQRYVSTLPADEDALTRVIIALASEYGCYGYPAELTAADGGTSLHWLRAPSDVVAEAVAVGGVRSDDWGDLLETDRPIVSLTYPDGMAGQANPFGAACVATLARAVFLGTSRTLDGRADPDPQPHVPWTDAAFWERRVGVVTPHRAQRAQILAALAGMFPDVDPALIDGAIDTVERFQGGPRHTILISFGLGDPDVIGGEERFLLQLERTNVALSQAMAKCIIVMS